MSNSSELLVGDSYNAAVLGHTLTVNTRVVDGKLLFTGVFTDGSGDVTITYNPQNNKFSFEQFFVFSQKDDSGEFVRTSGYVNYAILTRGENLELDGNGSFQGKISSVFLSQYESPEGEDFTETLEISGTGVGVTFIFDVSGEPTDLLESDYLGGPDSVPTDNPERIAEMKAFLVDFITNKYPALSEGNNPALSISRSIGTAGLTFPLMI